MDANGNARITGTFDGGRYNWSASKSTPMSTSTKPAPVTPTPSTHYDLTGKWNIAFATALRGTIDITSQSGNEFSGTAHIDSGKTERIINGRISGDTITFTRMWEGQNLHQDYTGTLSVDASGKITANGTFSTNDNGIWTWSASKSTSAPVTPTTPTTSTGSGADAFESGTRINWQPTSGLGYRLFRSTSSSSLGISVTDFYITSTSFADVNVEPKTTYYYTVKPVLAEAKPFDGIEEKLGPTIATFTVTTGNQTYKPGSFKHFILLKLESPYMSVDGVNQEIDPGRGTQPLIISGRTMVPIRAIVEAMGGTINWEAGTQKITLNARGNQVEMWLNKNDIKINGAATKMDVAPIIQNSRTFVPIRFAAENLNCKVDWINSTQEVVIVYED
ncbi:MAG: copper amine oxidase N-terminal domain-containing protein [Desulfotomaculaceae bacterium]|nr:copper amine oxidase N-terminal domain-containing protein [Desulfotomaculaceae bacterium]